jgi:hypothetical protein
MGVLTTAVTAAVGAGLNFYGQKQQRKGQKQQLAAQREAAELSRKEAQLRKQENELRFRRERRSFLSRFFGTVGQNKNVAANAGALDSTAFVAGQQAPANTLAANLAFSAQTEETGNEFFNIQSDRADVSTRSAQAQSVIDEGTAVSRLGTSLFSNAQKIDNIGGSLFTTD